MQHVHPELLVRHYTQWWDEGPIVFLLLLFKVKVANCHRSSVAVKTLNNVRLELNL